MTTPRNRGLPPGIASSINSAPAARVKKTYGPAENADPDHLPPNTPAATTTKKGGRPKGPDKIKKTFYLATDLSTLEDTQINLSKYATIRVKDESDTVDLALKLLKHMAALPEHAVLIKKIYKNELNQ